MEPPVLDVLSVNPLEEMLQIPMVWKLPAPVIRKFPTLAEADPEPVLSVAATIVESCAES